MNSSPSPAPQAVTPSSAPIALLAVLLSCLFSFVVILQNPLLNDDAYGYLRAAEVFATNGAQTVLETYGWYHYSFLIAWLDRVLPGDGLFAARVLNTALYALLTWIFIRLARELRDTPRVQLFAAACILLFPLVNEMRYFLIRDTGFWAFALLSVVFLIRYRATATLGNALGWCASLCLAAAFRLEALLLLALAPLSLLLPCTQLAPAERGRRFARLLGVLGAVAALVLAAAFAAGFNLFALIAFAYRYYLPELAELLPGIRATAEGVGAAMFRPDNFPGEHSAIHALPALLVGDLLALVTNLVNALGAPATLFLLYYRLRHAPLALPAAASRVLLTYIGGSLLALLLFVLIMHFLTQRYAALLCLLVLSMVPAMLDDVYAAAQQAGSVRRFRYAFGFLCFALLVDSLLSFGYSQSHIDQGIAWAHAEIPDGARVTTNNFALAYHSGRVPDYDKTVRDYAAIVAVAQRGDYMLFEVDHDADTADLDANPELTELRRFSNERGDEVRVYHYR